MQNHYVWTWVSQVKPGDTLLYHGKVDVRVLAVEEHHGGFILTLQRGTKVVTKYCRYQTLLYIKVVAAKTVVV